jgi:hypothetical protein
MDRRAVLRALGVVGIAGVAGCFGRDTTGTKTDGGGSPTATSRNSPTPTTDEATPTHTTICGVCVDARDLLVPDESTTEATAGETTTVDATFQNRYPFPVEDFDLTLQPPTDEWAVAPEEITFTRVAAESDMAVQWDVTIPNTAEGEYTLTTVLSFRGPRTDYTIRTNHVELAVVAS